MAGSEQWEALVEMVHWAQAITPEDWEVQAATAEVAVTAMSADLSGITQMPEIRLIKVMQLGRLRRALAEMVELVVPGESGACRVQLPE